MDINLGILDEKTVGLFSEKILPEPMSGCHLWDAAVDRKGYGRRPFYAHRVAWLVAGNKMDNSDCVLHKCDTPLCCNPDHLFLGSHKDNNHDMARKRRGSKGVRGYPYGVFPFSKCANLFFVQIKAGGKNNYFGTFRSIAEASAVAEAKRIELFGRPPERCARG